MPVSRAMLDKLDGRVPAQDGQQLLPPVQDTNGSQVQVTQDRTAGLRIRTILPKTIEIKNMSNLISSNSNSLGNIYFPRSVLGSESIKVKSRTRILIKRPGSASLLGISIGKII